MSTAHKRKYLGLRNVTDLDDPALVPAGDGGLRLHVEVCLIRDAPPGRHISTPQILNSYYCYFIIITRFCYQEATCILEKSCSLDLELIKYGTQRDNGHTGLKGVQGKVLR